MRKGRIVVMYAVSTVLVIGIVVGVLLLIASQRNLLQKIQDERAAATFRNCAETNARHDATVRRLLMLTRKAGMPDSRAAGTISLVDALVPKRDCAALVARSVQEAR